MDVKLRMYLCTYTRNYIRTVAKSTWGHKLLSQNNAYKMSDIPTGLNLKNEECAPKMSPKHLVTFV
jgi:hypothetical protein